MMAPIDSQGYINAKYHGGWRLWSWQVKYVFCCLRNCFAKKSRGPAT